MKTPIRLTIVTNHILDATEAVFWSVVPPAWAQVIDDPTAILKIPDGMRCHGVWTCGRHPISAPELAWRERRMQGGLAFLDDDAWDRLIAWRERKADGGRRSETIERPTVQQPPPEVQGMVLSQRWT